MCFCFIHARFKNFFSKRLIDFHFIKAIWSISFKFIRPDSFFFLNFKVYQSLSKPSIYFRFCNIIKIQLVQNILQCHTKRMAMCKVGSLKQMYRCIWRRSGHKNHWFTCFIHNFEISRYLSGFFYGFNRVKLLTGWK